MSAVSNLFQPPSNPAEREATGAVSNPLPTPFQPRSTPLCSHTPYTPGSVRTLGGMRTSLAVVPMPGFLCRAETDCPTVPFSLRKKFRGAS